MQVNSFFRICLCLGQVETKLEAVPGKLKFKYRFDIEEITYPDLSWRRERDDAHKTSSALCERHCVLQNNKFLSRNIVYRRPHPCKKTGKFRYEARPRVCVNGKRQRLSLGGYGKWEEAWLVGVVALFYYGELDLYSMLGNELSASVPPLLEGLLGDGKREWVKSQAQQFARQKCKEGFCQYAQVVLSVHPSGLLVGGIGVDDNIRVEDYIINENANQSRLYSIRQDQPLARLHSREQIVLPDLGAMDLPTEVDVHPFNTTHTAFGPQNLAGGGNVVSTSTAELVDRIHQLVGHKRVSEESLTQLGLAKGTDQVLNRSERVAEDSCPPCDKESPSYERLLDFFHHSSGEDEEGFVTNILANSDSILVDNGRDRYGSSCLDFTDAIIDGCAELRGQGWMYTADPERRELIFKPNVSDVSRTSPNCRINYTDAVLSAMCAIRNQSWKVTSYSA